MPHDLMNVEVDAVGLYVEVSYVCGQVCYRVMIERYDAETFIVNLYEYRESSGVKEPLLPEDRRLCPLLAKWTPFWKIAPKGVNLRLPSSMVGVMRKDDLASFLGDVVRKESQRADGVSLLRGVITAALKHCRQELSQATDPHWVFLMNNTKILWEKLLVDPIFQTKQEA